MPAIQSPHIASRTSHVSSSELDPGDEPNVPISRLQDARWTRFLPSRVAVYFMSVYFLLAFAELVPAAPFVKLFERSLCIAYYAEGPDVVPPGMEIPEELCKTADIQTSLAIVRGWKSALDTVPVLLAIPFAKLADRLGIRTVMSICLFGLLLSYGEIFLVCAYPRALPLRLVFVSSALLLCGGGFPSATSLMWAMASSSVAASERSDNFNFIFAGFYLAEFIGSIFSALTTDFSPWIPCGAAVLAILACLVQLRFPPNHEKQSYALLPTDPSSAGDPPESPNTRSEDPLHVNQIEGVRHDLLNSNMLLILPAFFAGSLRYTVLNTLVQYASNRFGMRISEGAYFYTETAIVNIFLFLFLVPSLMGYLRKKYSMRPGSLELYSVQASLLLLAIGSFLIGSSATVIALWFSVGLFAAGFGSKVFTISLISSWAADNAKPVLYAAVIVFQTLGQTIGDPSLQYIYAATLRTSLAPFWLGLPFFVASLFYVVSVLCTFLVRS